MEVNPYQAIAMSTYETTTTVEDHGQVRVAGVPFAPGTEVEVTISPKLPTKDRVTPRDDEARRSRPRLNRTDLGASSPLPA